MASRAAAEIGSRRARIGIVRDLARRTGASKHAKAVVRALGFDLVRRHFYSPIPALRELPDDVWERESDLAGLRFDVAAGLSFVERELAPYLAEYRPQPGPTADPRTFYLDNGTYGSIDAETLYAMVRRFHPELIIELGSGMSTLVIADGRARNGPTELTGHIVYDPHPRPDLRPTLERIATVRAASAVTVPLAEFTRLEAGDILFVDTSHTVKIGGDVNRMVLDVLPHLAPGVLVHFHDIFLPWEYPRTLLEDRSFFWAEQYLLQAFLAFNREFEVLFSTHALERQFGGAITKLVPSRSLETLPSALWLRRVEHGVDEQSTS